MKKIAMFSLAVVFAATTFQSCKKGATPKKLDGDWTVTSSESTYTRTNSDGSTDKEVTTFDGTTETVTEFDNGVVDNIAEGPKTETWSFDRKAGTYTRTTKYTSNYTETGMEYYEKDANGNYNYAGDFDRTVAAVSTHTEEGTFTITGGTGEIEKNSQIVLAANASTNSTDYTYTYFEAGTSTALDITGKYEETWGSSGVTYKALSKTENSTSTSTGTNIDNASSVLDVIEIEKGLLELFMESERKYESGAYSYTESFTGSWTLEQK